MNPELLYKMLEKAEMPVARVEQSVLEINDLVRLNCGVHVYYIPKDEYDAYVALKKHGAKIKKRSRGHVVSIKISAEALEKVPDGIYKLSFLQEVEMPGSAFNQVRFDGLKALKQLVFSDDRLDHNNPATRTAIEHLKQKGIAVLYRIGKDLKLNMWSDSDACVPEEEYYAILSLKNYDPLISVNNHHVTNITITEKGLERIPEQIRAFKKLQGIRLPRNSIRRIEILREFPHLWHLDLSHNQLSDMSDLYNLPLYFINLCGNRIVRPSSLCNLRQPVVILADNPIDYNDPLTQKALDDLIQKGAEVIDSKLPRTPKANISWNGQYVPRQEYLAFVALQKYEPEIWADNYHITGLSIKGKKLGRIPEEVLQLPRLERLVLTGAGISKIEHINSLKRLEFIDFSNNNIDNAGVLDNHPCVKHAILDSNRFASLEAFCLPHATKIVLANNQLRNFRGISRFSKLRSLNVNHNPLTSLDGLLDWNTTSRIYKTLHIRNVPINFDDTANARILAELKERNVRVIK